MASWQVHSYNLLLELQVWCRHNMFASHLFSRSSVKCKWQESFYVSVRDQLQCTCSLQPIVCHCFQVLLFLTVNSMKCAPQSQFLYFQTSCHSSLHCGSTEGNKCQSYEKAMPSEPPYSLLLSVTQQALFGLSNPCYYRLQFHLGSLQTQRANGEHRGSKIDLNSSVCHCMPVSATLKTRIVMKYFSTIKSINNTGGTSCLCLHGQSNRLQNALQSDLHQKIQLLVK